MIRYEFTAEQKALLESLQQPFAIYQLVGGKVATLVLSGGFCDLFGYGNLAEAYEAMKQDRYQHMHPDDVARISGEAMRFLTEGGAYEVIFRTQIKDGPEYRIVHAKGRCVDMETGERLAHIWYLDEGAYRADAVPGGSELNQVLSNALHEDSILKASRYNNLTGLPNMSYFFERAQACREIIERKGGKPALLFMDLSGMKFFNSKYGFSEGDRLLVSFAKKLPRIFGEENCCHIGGDHFAVFTGEDDLEATLRRLFDECRALNDGNSLPLRIGIYPYQMEDVPVSVACDRAKFACDMQRNTYESCFSYYSKALRDDAVRRQYVLSNIDRAIAEKWVRVYYQPIVRTVNGHVCDEEALARWVDPVRGFLSPAEFIPFLEDSGQIYKLDLYVVDQALEKMSAQKAAGLHVVPHSINLSRSDFDACDIVEEIRSRVDASGFGREMITIEITESVISTDFDFMNAQIERFQKLGFPVWMDDFGSGYSSLDLLQSIKFDLIKFDMSFMKKLDDGDEGKIILTELMKMATALGVDTVCEGVETEAQVHFLREIGCSKLQGFYYCKAIPLEQILDRYHKGIQIGYENPEEAEYYEIVGRINLFDFAVIASAEDDAFHHFFNTLPMGIIEIHGDTARFVRNNQSYRDFILRYFGYNLAYEGSEFVKYNVSFMYNVVKTCCEQGTRSFYDERMPDGSIVRSFARRIGVNPVNGNIAVAVVVLSITEPGDGATYADIARSLAADYYSIYAVDLDTERFIEYTSPVGGQEMAMERHGDRFFEASQRDIKTRIYEEDRDYLLEIFTKENIVKELDEQGAFTATYRLIDTGTPMYVNLKITRMSPGSNRIIMGISIVDSQMKQKEENDRIRHDEAAYAMIQALSGEYLSLYSIDAETGRYYEYSATNEYESLGFAKKGEDFFQQGVDDGKETVFAEDLPRYLDSFSRENVLREIQENGAYQLRYRLVIQGEPKPVLLKIVPVRENDRQKLIAGVRAWKSRR